MNRIFVDMDGTLTEWSYEPMERLLEEGYFGGLEPNYLMVENVNKLIEICPERVYILSAYLADSKYALEEKKEWLNKYLPGLLDENKYFVKCGENKSEFFVKNGLVPIDQTDILIDDYTVNLLEWRENGGTGVKFLNGINHSRGTWDGMCLDFDKEIARGIRMESILEEVILHRNTTLEEKIEQKLGQMGDNRSVNKKRVLDEELGA